MEIRGARSVETWTRQAYAHLTNNIDTHMHLVHKSDEDPHSTLIFPYFSCLKHVETSKEGSSCSVITQDHFGCTFRRGGRGEKDW